MLKRVLRNVIIVSSVLGLTAGIFLTYTTASDLGSGVEAEDLELKSCPARSEGLFISYVQEHSKLMLEGIEYRSSVGDNYEALAQKYNSLYLKHEGLIYPECADYLYHLISEGFRLRALAYSAKAQGGIIGEVKFIYYTSEAANMLYLAQIAMSKLMPDTSPIPDDRFETT